MNNMATKFDKDGNVIIPEYMKFDELGRPIKTIFTVDQTIKQNEVYSYEY